MLYLVFIHFLGYNSNHEKVTRERTLITALPQFPYTPPPNLIVTQGSANLNDIIPEVFPVY